MAAFWRNKFNRLEEENATLKEQNAALTDQVSHLQTRVSELQGGQVVSVQYSTESEESTRSQRHKRRKDGELDEEVSSTRTKRARVRFGEQDTVIPDPTIDEVGSEWDELGE